MNLMPEFGLSTLDVPARQGGGMAAFAHWWELAGQAAEANAFYHPALLVPALNAFDASGEAHMIEAWRDGMLIGLLPVEPRRQHGRFPIANVRNLTHDHCFFGAPLLRRGHEEAAWEIILDQLDRAPWSGQFLHLTGQNPDGPSMRALKAACARRGRPLALLESYQRAMLHSDMDADNYWQTHVRSKKRKELRRQLKRLGELGALTHRQLSAQDDLDQWCADFLTLEASGWKGRQGSALADDPRARDFFLSACLLAWNAGLLDMRRLDLDGRAVAMLTNFHHGTGSFSFKIAIDENYARYSPGILIEMDNLQAVLGDPATEWMDSCAAPDHPMIDSLWAERRTIAQYRVGLLGSAPVRWRRRTAYSSLLFLEQIKRGVVKGASR